MPVYEKRGQPSGQEAGLPVPGIGAQPPTPAGTGYFSTVDQHELTIDELYNSSMALGSDGFVYQVGVEIDPYDPTQESLTFGLAPQWVQDQILGTGGGDGARGPTAAELAIEQSKVQAANMANYLDGVIRGVDAEISAGRLSLEQGEAEFNRRMDALGEAGTQMANLWQWTVPEGAGTLHPDFREKMGMEPWKSQPVAWDPYAMAMEIVGSTPELTGAPIPTDPIQQALEAARGLI